MTALYHAATPRRTRPPVPPIVVATPTPRLPPPPHPPTPPAPPLLPPPPSLAHQAPPLPSATIREGTGKLDEARDCVALVALFREYATALTNRHPFTDEQFKTLTEKGTWLIQNVTPTNGFVSTRPPGKAERLDRDRLVRLLEQRYEQLRIAGAVCFGLRDVDAKVPPLWSAARSSGPPAEEPVPTPAPVA